MAILRKYVTADRRKTTLLEMMQTEKDKMSLLHGIRNVLVISNNPQIQQEILLQLQPKMLRFILLIKPDSFELEAMRAFLDENPEYVNKTVVECVARVKRNMIIPFSEKLKAMGGVKMVFDEQTSLLLLESTSNLSLKTFSKTGIVFTPNSQFICWITTADSKKTFLSNCDQLKIEKYTVDMARNICKHRMHCLFDQLRNHVKNTRVIDEYIRMVENKQRYKRSRSNSGEYQAEHKNQRCDTADAQQLPK